MNKHLQLLLSLLLLSSSGVVSGADRFGEKGWEIVPIDGNKHKIRCLSSRDPHGERFFRIRIKTGTRSIYYTIYKKSVAGLMAAQKVKNAKPVKFNVERHSYSSMRWDKDKWIIERWLAKSIKKNGELEWTWANRDLTSTISDKSLLILLGGLAQ